MRRWLELVKAQGLERILREDKYGEMKVIQHRHSLQLPNRIACVVVMSDRSFEE